MGQKIHPKSLRISYIQQNFIFKEKNFIFFKYSINEFLYNPSVNSNKFCYSEKTTQFIKIKQIIEFFLSKNFCIVNNIYIKDTCFSLIIYVEFFQYKRYLMNFPFFFIILQKHLSCVFFKKRPVIILYSDLSNSLICKDNASPVFIKRIITSLQGTTSLYHLTLLSINVPIASAYAKMIAILLEKNFNHQKVYDFVNMLFDFMFENKKNHFKGLKFQLKGRINGVDMAKKQILTFGSVPLQTIKAFINYGFASAYTPYGTCSVKVFFYYFNNANNT